MKAALLRASSGEEAMRAAATEAALRFAVTFVQSRVRKIEQSECVLAHPPDGKGCKLHFVVREELAVAAREAYSPPDEHKWREIVERAMKKVYDAEPSKRGKNIRCWVPPGTVGAKTNGQSPTGWEKDQSTVYFGFIMI